jgi:hypothetical protein
MRRWVTAGISVLALGMLVAGCGDDAADADAPDQVSPTESLLDPEQSGPVDAPAE